MKKAPNMVRGLDFGGWQNQFYSGLPIVTFRVPTPSTPHSILSPGESADTPAGVPVMMMSPAASPTCSDSFSMISGTL